VYGGDPRQRSVAADVVQDTFLAAHRHFGRFQGTTEAEFVSWLRHILATNLAMLLRRYLGTRGRDVRLERELACELDRSSQVLDRGFVAPSSSPSQQAARREQAVLLADALGQLPETYREVVIHTASRSTRMENTWFSWRTRVSQKYGI
jgi:RNA polymerase sigma-70 factor (ECF subfamily)